MLIRVNTERILLKTYTDAMDTLRQASWPLTMRFRKAVCKEGYLFKRSRGMRSSTRNWKRRYFVLENGILNYYTKPPAEGGEIKGQYALEGDPGSQTVVAIAPAAAMNEGEAGVMLVKGDDRLIMKDESNKFADLMDWGGKLYYAVAMANGGNPEMMSFEAQQLELEEADVAHQRWIEEQALMKRKHEEYLQQMHADLDAEHSEQSAADESAAQVKQAQMEAEMKALEAKQRAEADTLAREQEQQKAAREEQVAEMSKKQEDDEAAAAAAASAAEVADVEEELREKAIAASISADEEEADARRASADAKAEADAVAATEAAAAAEEEEEEADTVIITPEERTELAQKKKEEVKVEVKKRQSMAPGMVPVPEPSGATIKTGNNEFNYEADIGWFNM